MKTEIEKLDDVTNIATSKGNYDCNPYMHGMANGLILARAIMKNQEVDYLDAPAKYLDDMPRSDAAPTSAVCGND